METVGPQAKVCREERDGGRGRHGVWVLTLLLALVAPLLTPGGIAVLGEMLMGLLSLVPVVLLAAALAGWLEVSPPASRVLRVFEGGWLRGVLLASLVGALTPVCGLGVVPLIAVLLRRGVGLPVIMAFWVSSPVTDPAMLLVTAGVLGVPFAIAKTFAAFAMGLFAGSITALVVAGDRADPVGLLREPGVIDAEGVGQATSRNHWPAFLRAARANASLVVRWLALALVLEVFMQAHLPADWVRAAVGPQGFGGVLVAALVGAPLYLDGYAALPLVRGLGELGMSGGAALSLLVSGSALSIYSALAVYTLVRPRVFALYVALSLLGSIGVGAVAQLAGLGISS